MNKSLIRISGMAILTAFVAVLVIAWPTMSAIAGSNDDGDHQGQQQMDGSNNSGGDQSSQQGDNSQGGHGNGDGYNNQNNNGNHDGDDDSHSGDSHGNDGHDSGHGDQGHNGKGDGDDNHGGDGHGHGGDGGWGGGMGSGSGGGSGTTTPPVTPPGNGGGGSGTTTPPVATSTPPVTGGSNGGGSVSSNSSGVGIPSGGGGMISLIPASQGTVLGASIGPVQSGSCGIYLPNYIKYGADNNLSDVVHLQAFLNKYENAHIAVTGTYDAASVAAVDAFQLKYSNQILKPWADIGLLPNSTTPTGYVYKTTRTEINNLVCPSLDLPIPSLQ